MPHDQLEERTRVDRGVVFGQPFSKYQVLPSQRPRFKQASKVFPIIQPFRPRRAASVLRQESGRVLGAEGMLDPGDGLVIHWRTSAANLCEE